HPAVQSRECMAGLFWGDSPYEMARRSLRTALATLRKELGENIVITDRETLQFNSEFPLWLDVHEMETLSQAILSSHELASASIEMELYHGDLLQDFYEEWVLEEREHYRNLFINALLQKTQGLKTSGEYQ